MIQPNPKNEERGEQIAAEFSQIMSSAVARVQEENRQRGIPNVYSINGFLYYELPDGSLSREDPWQGKTTPPAESGEDLPD